jgi:hypothetical protein
MSFCLCVIVLEIWEREAERGERGVPAPKLDELEPEAIGEGDIVSVGERMVAVKLPVGLAP